MAVTARLFVILLAALLSACAGTSGPPIAPRVVASSGPFPATTADVLFSALGLVGTPYRYGGNTPQSGFDCSGLIGFVYYHAAGIALPRTTAQMSQMRGARIKRDALQAGDLLFFATSGGRKVSHAGIYVGEGRFVHAPSSGGTVRLDSLSNSYWQKSYLNAKRVLDSDQLAKNP